MDINGAMAEYVAVPEHLLYRKPPSFSFETAALTEPFAVAYTAVRKRDDWEGKTVMIIGAGTIGLCILKMLRPFRPAKILMCDLSDVRLETALRMGADAAVNPRKGDYLEQVSALTDGRMLDFTIEAVGVEATVNQSIRVLRPGGISVWVGVSQQEMTINMHDVVCKDRTIIGSMNYSHQDFGQALDLLAGGTIDRPEDLITHHHSGGGGRRLRQPSRPPGRLPKGIDHIPPLTARQIERRNSMTLYELGKYLKPDEPIDYHSVIRASLRVCDVTDEMMTRCGTTVYLMGDNGVVCGKIARDVLNFLRERQQRSTFVDILDQISEGVIAVDDRGRIFYLNQAYAQILGVKPYKAIGKYIQNIEPGSLLSKAVSTHREMYSGKKRVASVDKYISVHIFPVFSRGQFAGAFSVFQDATEVHDLHEKLNRMKGLIREIQSGSTGSGSGLRLISPITDGFLDDMLRQCERQLLLQVLAEENDNRTQAIERLGLSRRTFYRKCSEYGLKKRSGSDEERHQ